MNPLDGQAHFYYFMSSLSLLNHLKSEQTSFFKRKIDHPGLSEIESKKDFVKHAKPFPKYSELLYFLFFHLQVLIANYFSWIKLIDSFFSQPTPPQGSSMLFLHNELKRKTGSHIQFLNAYFPIIVYYQSVILICFASILDFVSSLRTSMNDSFERLDKARETNQGKRELLYIDCLQLSSLHLMTIFVFYQTLSEHIWIISPYFNCSHDEIGFVFDQVVLNDLYVNFLNEKRSTQQSNDSEYEASAHDIYSDCSQYSALNAKNPLTDMPFFYPAEWQRLLRTIILSLFSLCLPGSIWKNYSEQNGPTSEYKIQFEAKEEFDMDDDIFFANIDIDGIVSRGGEDYTDIDESFTLQMRSMLIFYCTFSFNIIYSQPLKESSSIYSTISHLIRSLFTPTTELPSTIFVNLNLEINRFLEKYSTILLINRELGITNHQNFSFVSQKIVGQDIHDLPYPVPFRLLLSHKKLVFELQSSSTTLKSIIQMLASSFVGLLSLEIYASYLINPSLTNSLSLWYKSFFDHFGPTSTWFMKHEINSDASSSKSSFLLTAFTETSLSLPPSIEHKNFSRADNPNKIPLANELHDHVPNPVISGNFVNYIWRKDFFHLVFLLLLSQDSDLFKNSKLESFKWIIDIFFFHPTSLSQVFKKSASTMPRSLFHQVDYQIFTSWLFVTLDFRYSFSPHSPSAYYPIQQILFEFGEVVRLIDPILAMYNNRSDNHVSLNTPPLSITSLLVSLSLPGGFTNSKIIWQKFFDCFEKHDHHNFLLVSSFSSSFMSHYFNDAIGKLPAAESQKNLYTFLASCFSIFLFEYHLWIQLMSYCVWWGINLEKCVKLKSLTNVLLYNVFSIPEDTFQSNIHIRSRRNHHRSDIFKTSLHPFRIDTTRVFSPVFLKIKSGFIGFLNSCKQIMLNSNGSLSITDSLIAFLSQPCSLFSNFFIRYFSPSLFRFSNHSSNLHEGTQTLPNIRNTFSISFLRSTQVKAATNFNSSFSFCSSPMEALLLNLLFRFPAPSVLLEPFRNSETCGIIATSLLSLEKDYYFAIQDIFPLLLQYTGTIFSGQDLTNLFKSRSKNLFHYFAQCQQSFSSNSNIVSSYHQQIRKFVITSMFHSFYNIFIKKQSKMVLKLMKPLIILGDKIAIKINIESYFDTLSSSSFDLTSLFFPNGIGAAGQKCSCYLYFLFPKEFDQTRMENVCTCAFASSFALFPAFGMPGSRFSKFSPFSRSLLLDHAIAASLFSPIFYNFIRLFLVPYIHRFHGHLWYFFRAMSHIPSRYLYVQRESTFWCDFASRSLKEFAALLSQYKSSVDVANPLIPEWMNSEDEKVPECVNYIYHFCEVISYLSSFQTISFAMSRWLYLLSCEVDSLSRASSSGTSVDDSLRTLLRKRVAFSCFHQLSCSLTIFSMCSISPFFEIESDDGAINTNDNHINSDNGTCVPLQCLRLQHYHFWNLMLRSNRHTGQIDGYLCLSPSEVSQDHGK